MEGMKKVKIYLELWQSFLFYRIIKKRITFYRIKTIYKKKVDLLKRFPVSLSLVKRFNWKKVEKSFAGQKNIRTFVVLNYNNRV